MKKNKNIIYDIGSWEQLSGTIDNTDEIEELEVS
jgi:hypothetical protein